MLQWTQGYKYLFKIGILFPLGKYPGVELLDHMIVLFLIFWGNSILIFFSFFNSGCTNLHPYQQCTKVSLKNCGKIGTSLEVQWLRLRASTARGTGPVPVGELRSHMWRGPKNKKQKKNPKQLDLSAPTRDVRNIPQI